MTQTSANDSDLYARAEALLRASDMCVENLSILPLTEGGNNRVFKLTTTDQRFILKFYFQGDTQTRDRQSAEWTFLTFASELGLKNVPSPLASEPTTGAALFSFVDGIKLQQDQLTHRHVQQAADFVVQLNARPDKAGHLPTAAEGGFSAADHIHILDSRLSKFANTPASQALPKQVTTLLSDMSEMWARKRTMLTEQLQDMGQSLDQPIAKEDRIISPSDFGFHNALITEDGSICFLDFEYAGWDDPAKLINDFFFQPAIPVDLAHYDDFACQITQTLAHPKECLERAQVLRPLFGLRWCCIFLNPFLPIAAVKDRAAGDGIDLPTLQLERFKKATDLFHRITSIP